MKRICRGRDRQFAGVCGGIAEYFGWDPTLIRLAWIILVAFGGAGIYVYIIAAVLMPERCEYE